jgi:rhodanese-related sulfurtransferase
MNRLISLVVFAVACSAAPTEVMIISPDDLLSEPDSTLILDVRTPAEFASGHVPKAINIPHDQLAARLTEIDDFREAPVVVYCEHGGRAGKAESLLADAGFSKIHHLEGDMSGWRERDLPTEPADKTPGS